LTDNLISHQSDVSDSRINSSLPVSLLFTFMS